MTTRFNFLNVDGIAVDGGADVGEWADGDERDVAGIFFDLVEEEIDGLRVGFLRDVAGFGPLRLAEIGLGFCGDAFGDGDICGVGFDEEAVDHARAEFCIAPGAGDAEDFDFGAGEGEADGEDVVNVVADVGVDDDFCGVRGRFGILSGGRGGREDGDDCCGDDCADEIE